MFLKYYNNKSLKFGNEVVKMLFKPFSMLSTFFLPFKKQIFNAGVFLILKKKEMIKSILLIIATSLITMNSIAQEETSVLFIGNSYIYTNDLPNTFKNLALSLGDITTIDSKTNGGFTFQNHVNDPLTYQKIHSQPWDYVVLQGQSQEASFPYGQVTIKP